MDWNETFTRRAALRMGAATAATLAGGQGVALASTTRRRHANRAWRRSSYTPLVGKRLSVKGHGAQLRLTAVRDLPRAPKGSEDAFALVFHSTGRLQLPAHGLPRLHHPALGTVDLGVVPGAASARGQSFTAVINRLHG